MRSGAETPCGKLPVAGVFCQHQHVADDWAALAEAVAKRRQQHAMSQDDVAAGGGPSAKTIRQLELGDGGEFRPSTFQKLDRALSWRPGTSRAILDGRTSVEESLRGFLIRDEADATAHEQEHGWRPAVGSVADPFTEVPADGGPVARRPPPVDQDSAWAPGTSKAERIIMSSLVQLMAARPRTDGLTEAEALLRKALDVLVDERSAE